MISSFIIYLLIAFESALFGNILSTWIRTRLSMGRQKVSYPVTAFGFVMVISLSSYLALLIPLSSSLSIILFAAAIFISFLSKPAWRFNKPQPWLIALVILLVVFTLETATRRPLNSDTNLYHAQAIHWIENYPAVFGLGNLHGRLAFDSIWLIANAFYSFSSVLGRSLHVVSGFYFFFFSLFALSFIQFKDRGSLKLAVASAFLIFGAFQYLASDISSPGTDAPAALTVWLVFLITLKDNEDSDPFTPILVTALAAFSVVVKLSSVIVMLVPAGTLILNLIKREYRPALIQILVGFSILTPFLIRNLIQSGYLIYPFPSLDLFDFAWKVPLERVIEEKNAILVWGRLPKLPIQEVLAMPMSVWLPKWFANLTIARKALVVFSVSSPIFAIFNVFVFKVNKRDTLLHIAYSAGVFFWLFSTPDVRFGYSFLIPTSILNILPFVLFVFDRSKLKPIVISRFTSAAIALLISVTFIRSIELSTFTERLVLPRDYDRVKTQTCEVDGLSIFCAVEYNACSYHNFPCVPQQKDWVKRLGPDLGDGFFGEK